MKRRDQNQAYKEWVELKRLIADLDSLVVPILLRGTYDSGLTRRGVQVEDDFAQTNDPTGEMAIREPIDDDVHRDVILIASNIRIAKNTAEHIKAITPESVADRAAREIPDCLACGKPAIGRVRSGYDDACYMAWRRAGYPERAIWERQRRDDVTKAVTSDVT